MDQKLFLFDIDGTLISTHGLPRRAMRTVLNKRFDDFSYDDKFNFSGRTDWEIVEYLLHFDAKSVNQELIHDILHEFSIELEQELQNGKKPYIYAGVEVLLQKLHIAQDVYLGLVTGNIKKGAHLKLRAAGLSHYFPVGGFGDDSKYRNDLAPIAIQRAKDHYKFEIDKRNIWIIGDSVYDVICAQKNALRCLAVGTGWTQFEELEGVNPEYLVRDLSDLNKILNILLNS
jgi:phosphoglycolate phosphatase-like HAD superfamily hydrolase